MLKFNATKLAAVAVAQSTEETRYYLCGVYFTENKAVATDGHVLTVATNDPENNTDDSGIFPVSKKAITAMKNKKADHVVFDGDTLKVFEKINPTPFYMEPCAEIDAKYPDYTRIIPEPESDHSNAGFSCTILARLADTGKILSNGSATAISMRGDDKSAPHIVTYHCNPDVFSVAMPMRT